ncbi:MAG: ATP-binding cassette domain-containing protein [Tissierellia bacterium]|nr:ATP-binding cassette domain-containing protein [Tissierellia bacterium]
MKNFIKIKNGVDKDKQVELPMRLEFGEIYTIVGNTGSGKSQLIEDIASYSQGDSITRRVIGIGESIDFESAIAHLSQHMTFVADCTVKEFFETRFTCQNKNSQKYRDVIKVANMLTGEDIHDYDILTKLSG